jgi:signal transduction histidine kinase
VQEEEILAVTSDGRSVLLDVTVQSRTERDHGEAFVLLLRDASEKRRIREQIKRADQLALLGGMAARVAHEVRTPLASVRGLVELLRADLPAGDRRHEYTERILTALERQEQLVQKLLTLTHAEPGAGQPVYIRELLHDLVSAWPGQQQPSLAVDGRQSPVYGDPVLLNEVFTNLVRNAFEASTDGDVIVRMTVVDATVRITVSNRGNGIPPELHERIFQPFFTTKPRGTGLGLAIARQVVEAHHGTIRVESDGQTATHFVVELPMRRDGEPALAHA